MRVRAKRGVCVGVDRHLRVDDTADLEPALVVYLESIGAVERIVELTTEEILTPPVQPKATVKLEK